ncbi:MAG TPA: cysteine synthase A [Acidobacteriota bacterium]|jgi:cysteine synthase A
MLQRPLLANNILELIGYTPLVRLNRVIEPEGAEILVKLESFNPMWSVKDRIGAAMLQAAEREGRIRPGRTTIVEPTSGNTGIGLAMAAAVMGYHLILTMPDTMTIERRRVLAALGAEIVLTPGSEGMRGSIRKAEEILGRTPNSFMPQQFDNPANPEVHRRTTAIEILEATEGRLDALVSGVGTGGTVTGAGEVLKQKIPGIKIVAVEPVESAVLSGCKPGPHKIQGMGAGFIPSVLNVKVIDQIIQVHYEDARDVARRLAREEGIFVGISSGAIVWAALKVSRDLGPGKRLVAVLPDLGERYLSHDLYAGVYEEPAAAAAK